VIRSIDFVSTNREPVPILIGITCLKTETTEWVGLNEKLKFRGYTFIPTRIETLGTFTAQFSIFKDSRLVSDGFGIRQGQQRSLKVGNDAVTIRILSLADGKVNLAIEVE